VRVVLVGPVYPYRGGIAHYTTMLYRALRERGHDVLMVSFKRQYPRWLYPGKSDKDPSKKPLVVEDAKYWIDSLNPVTWLVTFWRMRAYRPDLLILPWWTTFWAFTWIVLGALYRIFLRKPLVYICHNVLPHEVRWWDRWLTRWVLRWGTEFIVQSRGEQERLMRLLPEATPKLVPHPIYDMFGRELISQDEARRLLGLPLNANILLFFGIVRRYKGLAYLLAALPAIRDQLPNALLVVAGEFWEDRQAYLTVIEELGIGDLVVVQDRYIPNEEVALFFSAANVVVLPYVQATQSGVVQLALGCNRPVITTAVGGLPELVRDGENGLLVPPGDSRALSSAVICYFSQGLEEMMKANLEERNSVVSWTTLLETITMAVHP